MLFKTKCSKKELIDNLDRLLVMPNINPHDSAVIENMKEKLKAIQKKMDAPPADEDAN